MLNPAGRSPDVAQGPGKGAGPYIRSAECGRCEGSAMEPCPLLLLLLLLAPCGRGWAVSGHAPAEETARTDGRSVLPGECRCVPVRAWSQSRGIRGGTSPCEGNWKKSQHSPQGQDAALMHAELGAVTGKHSSVPGSVHPNSSGAPVGTVILHVPALLPSCAGGRDAGDGVVGVRVARDLP